MPRLGWRGLTGAQAAAASNGGGRAGAHAAVPYPRWLAQLLLGYLPKPRSEPKPMIQQCSEELGSATAPDIQASDIWAQAWAALEPAPPPIVIRSQVSR